MNKTNINYYQFLILQYLAGHQDDAVTYRELADNLLISNSTVMNEMNIFADGGLVGDDGKITEAGLSALEPYRIQRAVILAAGFGSRMMPATADRPKPMVAVNGKPIVTTLLDALLAAGIQDITIVRGYQKQKFDELLADYPMLRFIDNDDYTANGGTLDPVNRKFWTRSSGSIGTAFFLWRRSVNFEASLF